MFDVDLFEPERKATEPRSQNCLRTCGRISADLLTTKVTILHSDGLVEHRGDVAPYAWDETYRDQARDFIRAIKEGVPAVGIRDAAAAVAIALTAVSGGAAHGYVPDPVFDLAGKTAVLTGACGFMESDGPCFRPRCRSGRRRRALRRPAGVRPTRWDPSARRCRGRFAAAEVAHLVVATHETFDSADILINAHQYKPTGFLTARAEDFPEELWDAVVDVNLKGTFLMCRDFGREMLKRGSGSIVNFASTSAWFPQSRSLRR